MRPESPKATTTITLLDVEAAAAEEVVKEEVAVEAEVADAHQASLAPVPTKTNDELGM